MRPVKPMRTVRDTIVRETPELVMYERVMPGKTIYIIFRKTPTCLEEIKRMRGGGHTTRAAANYDFDRHCCIELFREGHLAAKPDGFIALPANKETEL